MKEEKPDDIQISLEMYNKTAEILKKKGGNKYDLNLKGGKYLHNALFKLYEMVGEEERKPDSWRDSVLIRKRKRKKKRIIQQKTHY